MTTRNDAVFVAIFCLALVPAGCDQLGVRLPISINAFYQLYFLFGFALMLFGLQDSTRNNGD